MGDAGKIDRAQLDKLVHDGIKAIMKRNGDIIDFDEEKIADAVFEAARTLGGTDYQLSWHLARKVHNTLPSLKANGSYQHSGKNFPHVEDIHDAVEHVLRKEEHENTYLAFRLHRRIRSKVRQKKESLKVFGDHVSGDSTDKNLLIVDTVSKENSQPWDSNRITVAILNNTNLGVKDAKAITKSVENTVFMGDFQRVNTDLLKELVNAELAKRGFRDQLRGQQYIGLSSQDIRDILLNKSKENSNVKSNNPEANNAAIAGYILKKWAIEGGVFSREIGNAHLEAKIHVHDLDFPTRVYCSSHSIEYLKKYGMHLENLQSNSRPAKHADTLVGHLNTFLASMQAYYAGALGLGYINIMFAPILESDAKSKTYMVSKLHEWKSELEQLSSTSKNAKLEGIISELDTVLKQKDEKEVRKEYMKQLAQSMIFNGAQNAFSRGGQTIFLDFNIHANVPEYLKSVPAIGPSGKYMLRDRDGNIKKLKEVPKEDGLRDLVIEEENRIVFTERFVKKGKINSVEQEQVNLKEGEKVLTYSDFEETAQEFAEAMMEIWENGDGTGAPFAFPKCDFHVDAETLKQGTRANQVFKAACRLAKKNGSTYFILDRDAATLSACCRLRTTIEDDYMIKHPESMRFCGFQNVTINLPQASYRAGKGNTEALFREIDEMMDLAVQAHLEKREWIKICQQPSGPQWQTGKPAMDRRPYVDLDKSTYIIGLIGLNELVQHQTGKQLHELAESEFKELPLRIVAHMNVRAKQLAEIHKLKFTLEETPAESTTRRFSNIDLIKYKSEAEKVVKGSIKNDQTYYTNSIHLAASAPVDLVTRIKTQSMFHSAIDSGAIIHAFVKEKVPSEEAIAKLVENSYKNTQAAQITISPTMTVCKENGHFLMGEYHKCPECGSENVYTEEKIVGYLSPHESWNKSKLGEKEDRGKGIYSPDKIIESPLRAYKPGSGNNHLELRVFGKEGCDKCESLTGRTEKQIQKEYAGKPVHMKYYDMLTENGMAESMFHGINPARIPTMVAVDKDGVVGRVETDYSKNETSVILPQQVRGLIDKYLVKNAD
jgi:ribonucleoside-triphosphate reductase